MYPVTSNYISNLKRVPNFRTTKQRPDRAVALIIVRLPIPIRVCCLCVYYLMGKQKKKLKKNSGPVGEQKRERRRAAERLTAVVHFLSRSAFFFSWRDWAVSDRARENKTKTKKV